MNTAIDLNADLGEGAPSDDELLSIITSANVACGGHAGDDETMRRTVRLARARGVGVGAHPSYPDREGFGRRVVPMSPAQLSEVVAGQIRALARVAEAEGVPLQHVKAHGALYNVAVDDAQVADAIGRAMLMVDPALIAVALSGSPMADLFVRLGLRVIREAFIDRGYSLAGTLLPRHRPGAIVTDPAEAGARAVRMVREGLVRSVDGEDVRIDAQTLCVHADTPGSPAIAAAARRALEETGVRLAAMGELI